MTRTQIEYGLITGTANVDMTLKLGTISDLIGSELTTRIWW